MAGVVYGFSGESLRLLRYAACENLHMPKQCAEDGCSAPHFGRGYCNLHYWRFVRSPKRDVRMEEVRLVRRAEAHR